MDPIEIKIRLNVDKEQAEELYDEIESYLSLCIESILERFPTKSIDQIIRVISTTALTGFLIEKLGNSLIKVENVELFNDLNSFVTRFHISINVPNLWATSYGKSQIDERLNDAISFFQDKPIEAVKKPEDENWPFPSGTFNGLPCNPIIGSIYYDQLRHCMKRWDGSKWHDA